MEKKLDLRIEKTYLALHNAFTALLEEKRFEDFTLNELCDRAMIRRTTFYKHFGDKYEYFLFYIKETCASIQDQFPAEVESVNEYFLYMCRELVRFLDRHEKMVKNCMSSNLFPMLLDGLTEQIMSDILSFLRRSETMGTWEPEEMENMAAFYSGGIVNTLRLSLRRGGPINETQFTASIAKFLNHGTGIA